MKNVINAFKKHFPIDHHHASEKWLMTTTLLNISLSSFEGFDNDFIYLYNFSTQAGTGVLEIAIMMKSTEPLRKCSVKYVLCIFFYALAC